MFLLLKFWENFEKPHLSKTFINHTCLDLIILDVWFGLIYTLTELYFMSKKIMILNYYLKTNKSWKVEKKKKKGPDVHDLVQ